MSTDLQSITPRQVQEARAEVDRLEAVWRRYEFADAPPGALAHDAQLVDNLARDLENRRQHLNGLIGKRRGCRAEVNKSSMVLRVWELCHSPFKLALLGAAVMVFILLCSLCAGFMVKPAFGLLVGLVLSCLAILMAVLGYYASKEWGEGWVAGVRERLAKAWQDLEHLGVEVDQVQGQVRAARQQWEQATTIHERMVKLDEIAHAYRQAR
jgi:hypothetical protein